MEKKLNQKIIVKFFFTILLINFIFFSYRLTFRTNAWIVGDWFINYEGGLIRRGLSGEIIFYISDLLHSNPLILLFMLQISFFYLFLVFFYKLASFEKENILKVLLILSPATFLFTLYDPLAIGRKEIIFFLFFIFYTKIVTFYQNFKIRNFIIYFLLSSCFVLIHEIFLIFLPFLFLIKILTIYPKKIKINFFFDEVAFFTGSVFAILLIIFFSNNDILSQKLICEKIISYNIDSSICKGALSEIFFSKYLHSYKTFGIWSYILDKKYLINYGIYLLIFLSCIFLYFYKMNNNYNSSKVKIFFTLFFIQLCFLLIIFFVVNDWGRYLNIFFILTLVIIFKFYNYNLVIKNKIINYSLLFLIFINSTLWHMPHCCSSNLGSGIFSLKDRFIFRLSTDNGFDDKPRQFIINMKNYFFR